MKVATVSHCILALLITSLSAFLLVGCDSTEPNTQEVIQSHLTRSKAYQKDSRNSHKKQRERITYNSG
ncbi:MAG: hypothetical protein V3T17_01175 [Pseudomonadales bacterium]